MIPGVGHLISAFIVLGGIAFNIGNIGGAGLAMNVIFGIPPVIGSLIAAVLIIGIFLLRNAKGVMDSVMQVLGLVMLCMIGYAMLQSSPPLLEAVNRSFNPDDPLILLLPIVTLVGGTVGGYISFSGGHRLVEAGITGVENVRLVTRAAVTGIATTGVVRICLFWPRSGRQPGLSLDPSNPAASVFSHSMGTVGLQDLRRGTAGRLGVIGDRRRLHQRHLHVLVARQHPPPQPAYGDRLHRLLDAHLQPGRTAGEGSGGGGHAECPVLPLALGCVLLASRKPAIVGDRYRHPTWMLVFGLLAMVATAVGVVMSFNALLEFWQS